MFESEVSHEHVEVSWTTRCFLRFETDSPGVCKTASSLIKTKKKTSITKARSLQPTFPNSGSPKCGQMTCTATFGRSRITLTRHL